MSESARAGVTLGAVAPNGSRQLGRRSAVLAGPRGPVAGTADGRVRAFDPDLEQRWRASVDGSVVALAAFDGGVLVGTRSASGEVALLAADGTRWRYRTSEDVGPPAKETRFWLPFVASVAVADGRAYVAARRYERDGDARGFESVVYAVEADGNVAWRYRADASPIAVDADDERVAVAYNRCHGDHAAGLVVLGTDGMERWRFDPAGNGPRRVGDVALVDGGAVATGHADYRGYWIEAGETRWCVDLGRPVEQDGERVYAYPNHVHATDAGALFVTGNTYPEEGRETDARHPNEHTAFGVRGGDVRWRAAVGGFAHAVGTDGDRAAVPVAQHFRERDHDRHGVRTFDVADGEQRWIPTEGVATVADLREGRLVAVEEPVRYHDDGALRGDYRLLVRDV